MSKALITGGGGFVGPYLRTELQRLGAEVWSSTLADTQAAVAVTGPADHVATNNDATDNVARVTLDVRHAAGVKEVLKQLRPTEVYHLAGITRPASGLMADFFEVNLRGTLNVLEAAAEVGASVLVVSSAYVYGAHQGPIDEDATLRPVNHYGSSKAAADLAAISYALAGNRVVRVRPFNHVGPGQSPDFLLPTLVQQLARIEAGQLDPVLKLGNLDSVRDFTDVRDIVQAYPRLLREGENGEVYNLASGRGVSVRELAELVMRRSRVALRLETEPSRVRATDIPELVGNATKAREAVSWTPNIPLEQTLDDMLSFERARYA